MGRYRFLAYDLRTNAKVAELPLSSAQVGGALSGPGPFRATLPVSRSSSARLLAATIPERTVVFVERDRSLLDGWIIWRRQRSGASAVWELAGSSLSSYLWRNAVRATLTYAAADQFAIGRGLVDHLQSQPGCDIGIATGSGVCGVTRDRTYWAHERKNVGDALGQLAAVDNGFDWAIDVAWSTDAAPVPVKSLTLSYPRRGRPAGTTGLIFETGKNLLDYGVDEQGDRSARTADVLGAGDGADMRIGTHTRTDLLDAGYPGTSQVLSAKDVSVQATLDAQAVAATAASAATPTFWTAKIDPDDPDGGIGTWITGDDCRLVITDHNYPRQSDDAPGYEGWHRIIGWSITTGIDTDESVSLTLGPVAA